MLTQPSTIEFERRPFPDLGPTDALVTVIACGVCGSDVHHFRADPSPAPVVLGHEVVGVVAAAPSRREIVGKRVAIDPHRSCGTCSYCLGGAYNRCPAVTFLADPPTDGAFTTHLAVPAARCYPIPETMSDEEGALVEPAAVALWAATRARLQAGDHVMVVGAGPIGRLAVRAAAALGATRVLLIDPNPIRLLAESHAGIEKLPSADELLDSERFDVILECSGADGALAVATAHLAPGGRVVAVGIGRSPIREVNVLAIQAREGELLGSYRYANMFGRVIELIASGRLVVADLVTHQFSFDQVGQALGITRDDPSAVKPIVHIREMG